jgi:hypothetical protein
MILASAGNALVDVGETMFPPRAPSFEGNS